MFNTWETSYKLQTYNTKSEEIDYQRKINFGGINKSNILSGESRYILLVLPLCDDHHIVYIYESNATKSNFLYTAMYVLSSFIESLWHSPEC